MDTKWKRNKIIRQVIGMLLVLTVAAANLAVMPRIQKAAKEMQRDAGNSVDTSMYDEMTTELYGDSYVLYLESLERNSGGKSYDASIFLPQENQKIDEDEYPLNAMNAYLDEAIDNFSISRQSLDYAVFMAGEANQWQLQEKNTTSELADYLTGQDNPELMERLEKQYGIILVLTYDENGIMEISNVYTQEDDQDQLLKMMQSVSKNNYFVNIDSNIENNQLQGPVNMRIIFGIPTDYMWSYYSYDHSYDVEYYYGAAGGYSMYALSLIVITVLAIIFIFLRRREYHHDISQEKKYPLLELALIGGFLLLAGGWEVAEQCMWLMNRSGAQQLTNMGVSAVQTSDIIWFVNGGITALLYLLWYACLSVVGEIGVYGIGQCLKERSIIGRIVCWSYEKIGELRKEVSATDLSQDWKKKLVKVLLINYGILVVISFFWFFGIFLMLGYTIVLYILITKELTKTQQDYQVLCNELQTLATGEMDLEIPESLGHFSQANAQLKKVQYGFSRAVEREVKSQQMKTELITNVSHDLKTPLTAITTYIALLQEEGITQQEQKEYISVLDRKAQRLRALIEDLFDISKANSDNLELDLADVDITSLIRQVAFEMEENFEAHNLQLRYRVPDEKVMVSLDGQKAYRIYENLLGNVVKYALDGTRVFIKIYETEQGVLTSIANTSREELDFDDEAITERFMRGDVSRNTPGSGLGLAIAKSFSEAMKGNLQITTEGDLFQVTILWDR